MQRRLLFAQVLVLAVIGVMDVYFGIEQRYFWSVSWWDIPLHMFGGMWAALFGAWVATFFNIRITLVRCVLFAFAVGAGWELFEYMTGIAGSIFMSYPVDTAKDLLDDVIGGAIAGYSVRKLL